MNLLSIPRLRIFLKAFCVVFFLCGFPLILTEIALKYVLDLRQKTSENEVFQRIDAKLENFQAISEPETFLRALLGYYAKKYDKDKFSYKNLEVAFGKAEKEYPGLFSFTIFDHQTKLVRQDIKSDSPWAAEKLLFLLKQFYQSGQDSFYQYRAVLAPLLGCNSKGVWRIIERPDLIITSKKPQKTWFFYYLGKRFSFFANIHRSGYPPMMPLQKAIKKKPKDGIIISLNDMTAKNIFSLGDSEMKGFLEKAANRFEIEPRNHLQEGGRLWSSIILDSRFRLIASANDDTRLSSLKIQRAFRTFAALTMLFSLLSALALLSGRQLPYVSIRLKLLGVFILSSGLPLLILAFTVVVYLDQRAESLRQNSFDQSAEILRTLDSKFPVALRDCQDKLQRIIKMANLGSTKGLNDFHNNIRDFRKSHLCTTYKLLASSSESFLISDAREASQESPIFKSLLRRVLQNINGEPEGNTEKTLNETSLFFSSFVGQEISDVVDNILAHLGKIIKIDVGIKSWFGFIEAIKDSRGAAGYIFSATWDKPDLFKIFLRKFFPFKPLDDGTELFAIDINPVWVLANSTATTKRYKRLFRYYPHKSLSRSLRTFMKNMFRTRRLSHEIISYNNDSFLATAIPGKLLEDLLIIAIKPEKPILQEIHSLRLKLISFGLLSLGFTSVLGIFLAMKFLVPIQELAKGVIAVKEKKFRYRIPDQDQDELGDLSNLFNNMMESLHEVNMGRQIQEKLFPNKELKIGKYSAFGISQFASELGGDYFDYLPIGENGMIILVGDVTGHGIPASLVMAMSKAIVISLANSETPVFRILETLNWVIFQTMRPGLNLTIGMLFIDSATHEIQLYNCGHPFPKKADVNGKISEIVPFPGVPLGIVKTLMVKPTQITLLPKERLIIYTDGLAESIECDEHVSGYDLLERYLEEFGSLPVEKACRDILLKHPFFKKGDPQPDDFTVVIVERQE